MTHQLRTLFLSPAGRIGRKPFIAAVIAWSVFYVLQSLWFEKTGTNQFNFYIAMVLLILNLHVIICIYGKRLHDLGRTLWALIAMFALMFIVAIVVMLNFGGLEYFNTLMSNPEYAQDDQAMKKIHQAYQNAMTENLTKSRIVMALIPLAFTLWLAVKSGNLEENRYGLPT